jgi:excisionase family DNA binding protein
MSQRYLSPAQVAEMLGVSRSTVLRLLRSGTLTSIRVGPRTIRVPAGALDAFICERSGPNGEGGQR